MTAVQLVEEPADEGVDTADILDPDYLDAVLAEYNSREGDMTAADWHARFQDGATFALDVPEEVPAVWGEGTNILWARGEAMMIVGPQGVGKTTIAGQVMLARLGLISKVLDLPVVAGERRVLYLACDRPRQAQRSLHRLVRPEYRDVLGQRLIVWKGPPPEDFARTPALLRQMCEVADADTVFVDSLKDVAIGLSEDAVGAAYNRARQLAISAGVEVVELHHQTKRGAGGQGEPNTLADVYGSTWITAGAGSIILIWGEAGDPVVRLRHLKQPAEEVGPLQLAHDHAVGSTVVYHQVDLIDVARKSFGGLTAPAAAGLMFEVEKPTAAQVEKARRRLDSLVKTGALRRQEGARGGKGGSAPATYHDASMIGIEGID